MRPISTAGFDTHPPHVFTSPPPVLQWLAIDLLLIDDSYQRPLGKIGRRVIRQIAQDFSWAMFSAVHVAPLEGGRYAIIDGQHRTTAAALLGIREVPCLVVIVPQAEQARAFAAVNGNVTAVPAITLFRASLLAGEPWATDLDRIVREADCRLMTSARAPKDRQIGDIYGVTMIRDAVKRYGEANIIAGLKAVRQTKVYGQNKKAYDSNVLMPILRAVANRPWLHDKIGMFFDTVSLTELISQARALIAERLEAHQPERLGLNECMEVLIGSRLDKAFPQRAEWKKP